MRKLFRAAFYRTENKKMIRIELVIAVLLSAFIILNNTRPLFRVTVY